ncbi:hypothetical protein GW17_00058135 [Ensete ventricosum]|nr:hypothetical protein GW17_00058135 [Ensete ventricosum]
MGSRMSMVSQRNAMIINFTQSRTRNRISIGFPCTDSEIQNNGHSQCIMGSRTNMDS